jgi:hypothetical protein
MKRIMLLLLLAALLLGCTRDYTNSTNGEVIETDDEGNNSATPSGNQGTGSDPDEEGTPDLFTPTPIADPFESLYGCEIEVKFISGPLESNSIAFTALEQDYFFDKEDKFEPGQGTGVYYGFLHYFILHSSYINSNILRPTEAEFLRKYLEYWGESGSEYIQSQMDSLEGSEVIWFCDGRQVFQTELNGIIRLSNKASNDLWMEPENLEQILEDREGLVSEWIGGFNETDLPYLYIGFCGWGPESVGDERYSYYRYLIRFDVIEIFPSN